jgi:hypothetical protein
MLGIDILEALFNETADISLRKCLTPVVMRFFNKKGMVMGLLEHSMLLNHIIPVEVSWRKCLIPMKSALS